jgi:hypothetical protein
MATSYISEKLSLNSADLFKDSFSTTSPAIQYVFIGNHVPYANESSPDPIVETISSEKEVWDNMFAAKRVTANDIDLVIPRVNWTSNTRYRQYDDTITLTDLISGNVAQNLKPFYAITSDRNVYKCLSNNASANSTIEPTGDYTTSNGVIATADGYIWKYMYNIRPANKFLTTDWIPVPQRSAVATTLTDFNLDDSGIVEGELTTVVVENGGSGYAHSSVTVSPFIVGCTTLTLANTTNVAENMTVTGTGIASGAFISSLDTPNNRIILSSSATANGGGAGNNLTVLTRIAFDGDGTGAVATATLNADSVSTITLSSIGKNFSRANAFVFGSGTGAVTRCIIAPKFGHAFNLAKDLLGTNVMVTSRIGDIDATEGGLISVDTSFRQFGLLRNPHKYGQPFRANNATANVVISQTTTLTLTVGNQYTLDEYVYQGFSANNATAYGYLHSQSATQVKLTRVEGTFNPGVTLTGLSSGVSRTVVAVTNPEFQPYTGDILYVENDIKTEREDGQAENIRFVIQF